MNETAEIIAQQKKLFREKFGREPGPENPLFFDPGVATPQFLSVVSQEEVWKNLLQAAGDSEIDPAIVYSMNKTGRIVTETNAQFLTDAELVGDHLKTYFSERRPGVNKPISIIHAGGAHHHIIRRPL